MANIRLTLCLIALIQLACSEPPVETTFERVDKIASEFVHGYYSQFPEEVYEVGYPDSPLHRFGDHSEAALAAWDARIDDWLTQLDQIDVGELAGAPAAITYVFARERMQVLVDKRICHNDLWNVSPTWTGWQFMLASTLAVQPVGDDEERGAALSRAADIARFLNVEVSNLRRGVDEGYVAAQSNVDAVVEQVTSLIETPVESSPFFSPATRSDNDAFIAEYRDVIESGVYPAMTAYRDFLRSDYPGRDTIGVSANPDGDACYAASARYWSSMSINPAEIHRLGLSEMARIQSEMLLLAQESFGTDNVEALLEELRTNPEYTFANEQAVLDFVSDAVKRSRVAVHSWFGNVPDADVVVIPSPAYKKDSGGGFYSAGSADGSRPGTIQIGTYNPTTISKAGIESLTFHEGYPGHHLQVSIALLNDSLHPILRYMFVSGSAEGWGLYSEHIAEEMGLYSSPVTLFGKLSDEAWRAARLVVEPGIHVMGWTRDQAIDYMMQHSAVGRDKASAEIDRYTAVPGQATSYLIGSLEIQRIRAHAETALGEQFDIRQFHDRILANGGVALPMLGTAIDAWIAEVQATKL
ncbi:MAG: DUF885 domain-containing protein [Proteobacteria bacterium]|nr:DUF885 domain-containing protein [Pseudomonadota bacterium]